DPVDADFLLRKPGVAPMQMRGRAPLRGWLRVDADHVRARRQLTTWVERGVAYARSLPPKAAEAGR
ncbi:MAG TPA: RNA methyltransferase, partial [Mycobacteriales bacterium]